ncbi:hypothetical protein HPP92_014669 [Vanilla planifolia]|uniref:PRONE domain-containing protein n=1 Tax=Vanilla planifolia TaxID=51239 RepID=A0A835UV09_VANPL|nr:hypothetical protein HPP92_014669 [Vanilla planifolia]
MNKYYFKCPYLSLLKMPFQSREGELRRRPLPVVTTAPCSIEEILPLLDLDNEPGVLQTLNRLEGAIFAWKQKISEEEIKKTPIRYASWYFSSDGGSEAAKMELWLERAEMVVRLLKARFPNLPHSFIDVTKVQYNKDVGYSIIEAYSRVLVNLAFSILSRMGDIMQEDDLKKPTTPIATLKFDLFSDVYLAGNTATATGNIRRSLIAQMNSVDGRCHVDGNAKKHSLLLWK